jgi:hypothetical protein
LTLLGAGTVKVTGQLKVMRSRGWKKTMGAMAMMFATYLSALAMA